VISRLRTIGLDIALIRATSATVGGAAAALT
jgi:hypothetical protein